MKRVLFLLPLLLGFAGLGCDNDNGNPTSPRPGSPITGRWVGEIRGTSGNFAFTCRVELDLSAEAQGLSTGTWDGDCPGQIDGPGVAATSVVEQVFILNALRGFGSNSSCGWGAQGTRDGTRLTGTWSPANNCPSNLAGGRFEMTRQ